MLQKLHISAISVECIIPESLHMFKVPAVCISRNLSAHDLCQRVASSRDLLSLDTSDKELFLVVCLLGTKGRFIIGTEKAN